VHALRLPAAGVLGLLLVLACGNSGDDKKGQTVTGSGGAPGAGGDPGEFGSGGAGFAGAPACLDLGGPCRTPAECCNDMMCIAQGTTGEPTWLGCRVRCTGDAECAASGQCCLLLQGQTFGFCTDAKWCSCGTSGTPCGGSNAKCCDDQMCGANDVQGSAYECRARCTQDSDCPTTGCCVEAFQGSGQKACLNPVFCGR